jgi:ABC-type Fe3+ transport system substrate-binding protein
MLAAGAKKEGKVVWYTALAGGSYKDLAQTFQAKYGVQVEAYRGTSKDLISKFLAEAQAKRYIMDVAESSPTLLMLMQALNDMIISGEVEASPTIFRNHALVAADKKAPVAWVPMEIVPASAGSAGLSTQAPRPHAAVLFVDFLFSPDGQKILAAYDYGSPAKEYGFKRWYPEKGVTIQQLEKDIDKWERELRELGRRTG